MKHYLPKNAEDASALILTLLVIVLLSTVVTSFLSSTRTEQTATRNYTSKTQAEQFASSATQQAMANLQAAFNGNGNGTAIVVSQPGAIGKYFLSSSGLNGSKTDLFFTASSPNATGLVNMNNLSGPNSTVNTTGLSITGNVSENVTVYSVDVKNSSGNQTIGRIAYYIDDEGTKVNLNSASSNRSTLNVGNARPLSLFGANLSANLTAFDSIVSGNNTGTRNIKTWTHFFRPEQAVGAGVFTGNAALALASISTTAPSGGNSTFTKTPWGTDRIYINTLSTNATDGTGDAAVKSIYEAFTGKNATTGASSNSTYGATGQMLSKIYGGNFSTKYTDLGVKQIAANMLQMRDPNTNTVNASFSYTGSLLGSQNANATNQIPNEYFGYAPYPIITKVGVSVQVGRCGGWNGRFLLFFCPTFEISNPYPYSFNATSMAQIKCDTAISGRPWVIDEVSFDVDHGASYGVQRYTWSSTNSSRTTLREPLAATWLPEQSIGTFYLPSIPAFSKIQCQPDWAHWWSSGLSITPSNPITINSVSNMTVTIRDVKIMVNGNIRDWVTGQETGPINCSVRPQTETTDAWGFTKPFPWSGNPGFWSNIDSPIAYWNGNLSDSTAQRFDWIRKTPMTATTNLTASDDIRNWTTTNSSGRGGGASGIASTGFSPGNWTESSATWIVNTSNSARQPSDTLIVQGNAAVDAGNSAKAKPSLGANSTIPSDPSMNDSAVNAVYPIGNFAGDMREPILTTGNFSCPSDLGLVPTNKRWRRLRMQPQPSTENTAGYIPDWALLDVVAFGQNATSANYTFTPVNPNGKFNVASGTPPAPRTSGLKALVQMLDTTSTNATLADPMNPSGNVMVNKTRFMGNNSTTATATIVAGNIANMTWSANSTWSTRRTTRGFPSTCLLLPSEVCEIKGVADVVSQGNYNNTTEHFKWNEGRVSAIIPGLTTCSNFFTIYAYAQAGKEINGTFVPDSEHLTKTLVEVEITTPATTTTSAVYKVKSLYTQSISMGE